MSENQNLSLVCYIPKPNQNAVYAAIININAKNPKDQEIMINKIENAIKGLGGDGFKDFKKFVEKYNSLGMSLKVEEHRKNTCLNKLTVRKSLEESGIFINENDIEVWHFNISKQINISKPKVKQSIKKEYLRNLNANNNSLKEQANRIINSYCQESVQVPTFEHATNQEEK